MSLPHSPVPKGILDLPDLGYISYLCDYFDNSPVYRRAFLLAFYALLQISNIAPPFQRAFDPSKHFLREDMRFGYPGIHMRLKWAKNIQAPEKVHWIKVPTIQDPYLCPVSAVNCILPPSPTTPLFAFPDTSLLTQSLLCKRLASILRVMGRPTSGHGFHIFRRSVAYDANIPLPVLQQHGCWRSDAIWHTFLTPQPSPSRSH